MGFAQNEPDFTPDSTLDPGINCSFRIAPDEFVDADADGAGGEAHGVHDLPLRELERWTSPAEVGEDGEVNL